MSSNNPHTPDLPPQGGEEIQPSAAADHPAPGMEESQDATASSTGKPEVKVYDFRRPARISKDRKRSLEAIYGVLAKSLEGWLRGRVRDPISLELHSVEELTYGEFIASLPSPCASYIIDERLGAGHQGVVDFGQELAFFLVDRLLGGTGQPALFERSLTPTERLLVRIAAERVTWQLGDVWKDYVNMDLNISGFESVPEMLLIANQEDPVLVVTVMVSTGDMDSPLTLCLPIAALEKFFISTGARKTPVAQGESEERIVERRNVEGTLRSARIPVQARFRDVRIPLGTLAALKPGRVLETGIPTDSQLCILVAGQKRFVGAPGKLGGRLAALVGESVEAEPEDTIQPGRGGI
jgi:flagellar motor switch protein FliM